MTTDELWTAAARNGWLRVESRQGPTGAYVEARCLVGFDGTVLSVVSRGTTVGQALEPIVGWRARPYYRIARAHDDDGLIYLQRTVAQEALKHLWRWYPERSFQLVCVTPGEPNDR
jgi:hypothetical protein